MNAQEEIEKLEKMADWLDSRFKIPGIPINFGVDSLLGLIFGVGDTVAFTSTAYILAKAHSLGVPLNIKLKIIYNGFIDWLIGLIPVLGDIFDVGWKSNQKNVALVKEHLASKEL